MTSQSKHCNDGPIPEELLLSGCLVENDSIQLQTLYEEPLETTRHNPRKRPRSATPESNDRLQISDSITQNVKLAQGSTGNAKVLLPFWNEYTREESKKWWLPESTNVCSKSNEAIELTVTVFVARHNGIHSAEEDKLPKPKSSKIPAGKAQRIRLLPTQEEWLKLRRWIVTACWTYNQCLSVVEKEGVNRNKKDLRARCLNAVNFRNNAELKWVMETPYDIRDEAMNDLLKGYSTNFATNPEPLPNKLEYDSRLVMNQLGEFYLCIPRLLEIRAENQGPMFQKEGSGVISLDSDVRTFMTGYDPSGMAVEWGKNDIGRIYRLYYAYEKLQSKRDQIHGKRNKRKCYRLHHVMLRIHMRITVLYYYLNSALKK
ncbi:hypothetical protein RclHR1_02610016 [Rhizophagus clarus]|uniref:Transposase putative helix-turn-helix domain-containing protein n=1 Tax=Rhizophagus clarus TaxID=94130 RepID=A0A2Z6RDX0_9GLOM|nr:hypothetical protein RclHR1_02610016 [Rhizophagus clarus]